MKTKKVKCPYCDGAVEANIQGRSSVFCTYCGQQILLDDGKQEFTVNYNYNKNVNVTKTIHNRYTDDADVIRATNEANRDSRDFKQIIIMMGIMFLIPAFIFGGVFLNKVISQGQGKVSAGYYRNLIGEDYKTVEAHFEAAGFTNIQLIDLNDAGIAFWNDGKVATISVGGDTAFESTDYFAPETKVVISYH